MLFFKTKKQKAFEKLVAEWNTAINKAVTQLESSHCKHDQSMLFMKYINHFNDEESLQRSCNILTSFINSKLHDGTPFLSKFYIYCNKGTTCSFNVAIHDESLVKIIDTIGFASISLNNDCLYKTETAMSQLCTHSIPCDNWHLREADVDGIVSICDKYYQQLIKLNTFLTSDVAVSIVPQYSRLYWNGARFLITVDVTPERVNEIIKYVTDCHVKYANEYREYLIQQLADKSVITQRQYNAKTQEYQNVTTISKIEYDIPHSNCDIYSVFEEAHIVKLKRQAKNQEHKAIINEIMNAAKQKLAK